jgi:hypothetical protein
MGNSISFDPTALLMPGNAAAAQGEPEHSTYPESSPLLAKSAICAPAALEDFAIFIEPKLRIAGRVALLVSEHRNRKDGTKALNMNMNSPNPVTG